MPSSLIERETPEALGLGKGVQVSRVGLRFVDPLSFEEWQALGDRIGRLANSSQWWLADWLFHGEWEYGKKYREAAVLSGYEQGTLRVFSHVAGRFDLLRRRNNLSFGHHQAVAALREAEQDMWLDMAEHRGWSRNELREKLQEQRALPKDADEPPAILLRWRVEPEREQAWRQAAERTGLELDQWAMTALDRAAAGWLTRA